MQSSKNFIKLLIFFSQYLRFLALCHTIIVQKEENEIIYNVITHI